MANIGDGDTCEPFPIENPSFETDDGWQEYEGGFEYTTDSASHGSRSISVINGGALQVWIFPDGFVTSKFLSQIKEFDM